MRVLILTILMMYLVCQQPCSPHSLIRSASMRDAICVPRARTLRADAQIPVGWIFICRRTQQVPLGKN